MIDDINKARKEQGVTQKMLEARTGIPQGHLSLMLAGKRAPNLATLEKVCKALGLKLTATPRKVAPLVVPQKRSQHRLLSARKGRNRPATEGAKNA